MAFDFIYIIALYFGIIWVLGDSETRVHSSIVCVSGILSICLAPEDSTTTAGYIYNINISLLWDGLTALFLTIFFAFDKTAWRQAALLILAVITHMMVVHALSGHVTPTSRFFYSFYDELIILVGLLQVAVSYDGFVNALNNVQYLLRRWLFDSQRCDENSLSSCKSK